MLVFFDMLGFTFKVFSFLIFTGMLFLFQVLESFIEPEIKFDNITPGGSA